MPGPKFVETTLSSECREQGFDAASCACAADAILSEVSPTEFGLFGIHHDPREIRAFRAGFSEAITACQAGAAPPGLGLEHLGEQPIRVTPQVVKGLFSTKERATEVAVNSCIRDTGASEATCECVQSTFGRDFDPYELGVMSFSLAASRELSPYVRGVMEECGVSL